MKYLDGQFWALELEKKIRRGIQSLKKTPCLSVISVGNHGPSQLYIKKKEEACLRVGIDFIKVPLSENSSQKNVEEKIQDLAKNSAIDGILLQLPLPKNFHLEPLLKAIPPEKDVDGLTTVNQGLLAKGLKGLRPCTPLGIMELFRLENISLQGKLVAVIGRSNLVGWPMGKMLSLKGASLLSLHSQSLEPWKWSSLADICIVATGQRGLVSSTWIKPGSVVVDVGIHDKSSWPRGDVTEDVKNVAGFLTPVPGGVGPMTVAALLSNVLKTRVQKSSSEDISWLEEF